MKNLLTILFVILLAVLAFVLFQGEKVDYKNSTEHFLLGLEDASRFITADEVANKLINEDPGFQYIDLRSEEEFTQFSLPNAINIPFEQLLNNELLQHFGKSGISYVLFGNSDIMADQANMILNRMGIENTFVLKGGLNSWAENIFNPTQPGPEASTESVELYNSRIGALKYFAGASKAITPPKVKVVQAAKKTYTKPAPKKTVQVQSKPNPPVKQAVEEEEEEGC